MLTILLLVPPLIPILISSFMKKDQRLVEITSVISSGIQLIASLFIANEVIRYGAFTQFSFFTIDALGALLILITATVGLFAVIYNVGYVREEILKGIIGISRARQSHILINLFLMVMFLAIIVNTPVLTWISIEATTLSTIFLISFYNKPNAIEAAWKYLVINSVGLMLAFLGTIIYLTSSTPFLHSNFITWQNISSVAHNFNPDVIKIAFIFLLIGYGTKVGLVPMHSWLPDAHSQAPSPISAILSGALLNIALLPILRFKIITDIVVGNDFTQNLFIFFGIVSIVLASLAIFKQESYKRLLAYSSIEHQAIILLGFGFGGLGVYAGLLHMVYHSLAKSSMFLLSGNILLKYESTKIKNVFGIMRVLPETGILFIIGFLALTGIPPFGLFMSEFYIILAGIHIHFWISVVTIFILALIFFGFFRAITRMMFGEAPENMKVGEYSIWTLVPPIILLGILIFLSIVIPEPMRELISSATLMFIK